MPSHYVKTKVNYKITEEKRAAALAWYYANQEKVRTYQEEFRRVHGVPPRWHLEPCQECGGRVTWAPSDHSRRVCRRCRKARQIQNNLARGLTTHGKPRRPTRTPQERAQIRRHVPSARRAAFRELKEGLWCSRCGTEDADTLEFHHRDPTMKAFTIAEKVEAMPLDELMDEMMKCDVVCANCHKKHHLEEYRRRRAEKISKSSADCSTPDPAYSLNWRLL